MLRRILGVDERDVSYERLLDALGVGGKGSLFESDQLDYKSELPQDSKKFAKAVTAFANKGGGVLVYGIKDVKEAAGRVEHVELGQATTSLNQRLNQSMRPLIPGLRWTPVEFPEQKGYGLLLLEIPPSPLAPHAVLDRHQAHFYWRQGRARSLEQHRLEGCSCSSFLPRVPSGSTRAPPKGFASSARFSAREGLGCRHVRFSGTIPTPAFAASSRADITPTTRTTGVVSVRSSQTMER